MKTAVVLFSSIAAQVAGNIILTKGMHSVSGDNFLATALSAAQNPTIWLGTLLLCIFFGLYSAAMSWADLSFIVPATSFGYVLNVACAKYFLNEQVSGTRWAGAIIICLGVAFVSRSEVKTYDAVEKAGGVS
jgi:drug/metabolite transporter (DMT)-like permease